MVHLGDQGVIGPGEAFFPVGERNVQHRAVFTSTGHR
jgi:hypothetical protein